MKKKDRIEIVQETLMRELARLDEDKVDNQEIARANAIAKDASSLLMAANLKIISTKLVRVTRKNEMNWQDMWVL